MNVGIIGIGGLGQMGIKLAKVSKYELTSMNYGHFFEFNIFS